MFFVKVPPEKLYFLKKSTTVKIAFYRKNAVTKVSNLILRNDRLCSAVNRIYYGMFYSSLP